MPKLPFEQYTPKESMERARKFMKTKGNLKAITADDFKPGNLLFLKYNAKDKSKVYDRNPLVMIMYRKGRHTLGLNFHWLPFIMRVELIRLIFSRNVSRVKNRKPIVFNYGELKGFLKKRGYAPCIRKYINARFSKTGYKVPNSQLLGFARLNMMMFTGGMSTEEVYAKACKKQL